MPLAREHWLFLFLFAAGTALRSLALLAYRPALIYSDSIDYLKNSRALVPSLKRPLGYPVFLRILPLHHHLALVPALQHLMGLAIAVLIYALLRRWGLRPWVAALAVAPALLDAYLIDIEEYVLSETLFHLLLVGAVVAILWRRRPNVWLGALTGLLLAGVALTRANGEVAILPVLAAALLLRPGWRVVLALVAAVAMPLAAYAIWFHHVNGVYRFSGYGGQFLYARVAPFADCSKFSVPRDERILCPTAPVGRRPTMAGSTVEFYMWDLAGSPVYRIHSQAARRHLVSDFAKRVVVNQPFTYLGKVAHDFLRGFAPIRTRHTGELPIARWQFVDYYPHISPYVTKEIRIYDGPRADGKVRPQLTRFLRTYQRFGFTPGPLLAIGLLLGIVAALGLGAAGLSGLRTPAFLFSALALLIFGASVAINQFTWRYQLPLNLFIPPAAAFGATALLTRARDG